MNQAVITRPIHRAVKYRAFPKGEVKDHIEEHFRATKEIFNTLLRESQEHSAKFHKDIDPHTLTSMASEEGKKYPNINRQAAYYVAPRIIYGTMRARKQGEGELKPKEIDSQRASFTIRCTKPVFKDISATRSKKRATINLPNIGELVVVPHREIPDNAICRLCTISRNPAGQYFFSVEYELFLPTKQTAPIKKPLGLDFSVPKLYVSSDRNLVPDIALLKIRKQFADKVAIAHRKLSKCKVGSKNYEKIRKRLAKLYQRMDNIRGDYIQKETSKIAANYDFISAETLSLRDMCERFRFYKSVHDDSWYIFVTALRYKTEAAQKQFRFVSRYYPSSKTCHRCGFINHKLSLADREYICPACHARLDRDYNAAKNIRDQALRDAGYKINYIRVGPNGQTNPSADINSVKTASVPSSVETPAIVCPTPAMPTPPGPSSPPPSKPPKPDAPTPSNPSRPNPPIIDPRRKPVAPARLIPIAEKPQGVSASAPKPATEGNVSREDAQKGIEKHGTTNVEEKKAKPKHGRPKGSKNKPKKAPSKDAKGSKGKRSDSQIPPTDEPFEKAQRAEKKNQ